jgi:hypothetical protein
VDLNTGVDASEDVSEVGVGYQGGSVTWVLDLEFLFEDTREVKRAPRGAYDIGSAAM